MKKWNALLETNFLPWGSDVGDQIGILYQTDAQVNPQKAYDSIVSDYGLSCSSLVLSDSAKGPSGRFRSPIYVFVNEWPLQYPIFEGNYRARYAWHGLDLDMVTENWNYMGNGTYHPGPQDIDGSNFLQSIWYAFLNTGNPQHGWLAVDAISGWPQNYNVFHITPQGSITTANLKSNICTYFHSIGLDNQTFWWCD